VSTINGAFSPSSLFPSPGLSYKVNKIWFGKHLWYPLYPGREILIIFYEENFFFLELSTQPPDKCANFGWANGGISGGSRALRPGSEDPHRHQRKLQHLPNNIILKNVKHILTIENFGRTCKFVLFYFLLI
jgi:hypothetical protein